MPRPTAARLRHRQRGPLAPRSRVPTTRRGERVPRPSRRDVHGQRRLQAHAHQLRVRRAPAVHTELRRRDGARPARRPEHRRRHDHVGGDVPTMLSLSYPEHGRQASARSSRPSPARTTRRPPRWSRTPPATRRCRSPTPTRRPRATSPTARSRCRQPLTSRATNAAQTRTPAFAALAETTGAADAAAHLRRPDHRRTRSRSASARRSAPPTCCARARTARRSPSRCSTTTP